MNKKVKAALRHMEKHGGSLEVDKRENTAVHTWAEGTYERFSYKHRAWTMSMVDEALKERALVKVDEQRNFAEYELSSVWINLNPADQD